MKPLTIPPNGSGRHSPLLMTLARNKVIDRFRRSRHRSAGLNEEAVALVAPGPEPAVASERRGTQARVRSLLVELSERVSESIYQRIAFRLRVESTHECEFHRVFLRRAIMLSRRKVPCPAAIGFLLLGMTGCQGSVPSTGETLKQPPGYSERKKEMVEGFKKAMAEQKAQTQEKTSKR